VTALLEARGGGRRSPVRIGPGAVGALALLARERDRVALVSCDRVLRTPFGRAARQALERAGTLAAVHRLPDGEKGKTLAEVGRAAARLLEAGCTRRSLVVGLGGAR
jgi:3-dehydroquinate synthetase